MLYLTRLRLNARSRQVQAELKNPYEMHRTLSKAFGDNVEVWQQARCLFRVEPETRGGSLDLLVQSRIPPDWERLSTGETYLCERPEIREFAPRLSDGQCLAFRLHANPTVCRDGKRRALDTEEQQVAWLARKGGENGFRLLTVRTRGNTVVQFPTAAGFRTTLYGVTFDGALRITEAERFLSALESGIGSGKAFGFGLLSVARVSLAGA